MNIITIIQKKNQLKFGQKKKIEKIEKTSIQRETRFDVKCFEYKPFWIWMPGRKCWFNADEIVICIYAAWKCVHQQDSKYKEVDKILFIDIFEKYRFKKDYISFPTLIKYLQKYFWSSKIEMMLN